MNSLEIEKALISLGCIEESNSIKTKKFTLEGLKFPIYLKNPSGNTKITYVSKEPLVIHSEYRTLIQELSEVYSGVKPNLEKFYHAASLTEFDKRQRNGVSKIYYGIAIDLRDPESVSQLVSCLTARIISCVISESDIEAHQDKIFNGEVLIGDTEGLDLDTPSKVETEFHLDTFSPEDAEKVKVKVSGNISLRRGQPAFRSKLLDVYGECCVITGTKLPSVLEAAHIFPYMGESTHHITNGLLLRADIHTLFDLGLIGINQQYEVVVCSSLSETLYESFNGSKINLPNKEEFRPSLAALKSRSLPNRT